MTRSLGLAGETKVALELQKQGFTIVERNYRIREAEVDIIAQKKDLITFVEVKTRALSNFPLSEVITLSKQKKIIFAAKHFLSKYPHDQVVYRFDVALVEGDNLNITYIPNAFAEYSW